MAARALRISHVGIRGIVGGGLTASRVMDFAAAFGTFVHPPGSIVLGRDPRASGAMLREGVVASLLACGHNVLDLGIASTPVIQHIIRRDGCAGGVSIGASHNSAEWNALKFFGRAGTYLSTAEASELLDIFHLKKFEFVDGSSVGWLSVEHGALDYYIDRLAEVFDFKALRRFRVLVDCSNGTSSLILRRIQERYGLNLILLNAHLEGIAFAHEPNTSRRIVALQLAPLMQPVKADAGFLFDIDSDRVAMATAAGEPVSEEAMLPMLADHLLPRGPGKLIVTNLSTTALLEDIAAKHGGRVVRVPVGRQAAVDALSAYREDQITIAGEGTGAVMMPAFRFIYDGIASMFAALTMMLERGQTLAEILGSYPKFSILKAEVPLAPTRIPHLLLELAERHGDGIVNMTDGVRVDWPNRWFHVRVSQTEPVVRVIAEQRGEPPTELFASLLDHVRSLS